MFDISFFEIMIISMIALIVVGPERLPQVARTLGHLMGRCRQFIYSVKTDIHNEIRMEELKNMHNTMQETVHSIENSVRKEINEIQSISDIESQQKITDTGPVTASMKPESDALPESSETRHKPSDKNNSSLPQ
ncbi:MAG: Sec-independent protein translocase protein TatB [Nitrosomonas sp.]|nr:Sec-independent protein translocase protein TatB [Nitrosomonas sp.]